MIKGFIFDNWGVNWLHSPTSEIAVRNNLDEITQYTKDLRTNIINWKWGHIFQNYKKAALIAKNDYGCTVSWGVSANPDYLTAGTLSQYVDVAVQEAMWSEENNITIFYPYNEESFHHDKTLTNKQIQDWCRDTLIPAVRQVYSGIICISEVQGQQPYWYSNKSDDIKIVYGLNAYGYVGSTFEQMTYSWIQNMGSDRGWITEWNVDYRSSVVSSFTENNYYNEILDRANILQKNKVKKAYFFAWDARDFILRGTKAWNILKDNINVYFIIDPDYIDTILQYGTHDSIHPHKNVHYALKGGKMWVQGEFSQSDFDYIKQQSWVSYYQLYKMPF